MTERTWVRKTSALIFTCAAVTAFISRDALSGESPAAPAHGAAWVDAERLANAGQDPDNWLTPGRDAEGTYYSPLDAIDDRNVSRLGFAWQYMLGTKRGLQGTPVVVDGVMYASGNWGR